MKKVLLYGWLLNCILSYSGFAQSLAGSNVFALTNQQPIAAEKLSLQVNEKIKFTENKGQIVDQQQDLQPHILFSSTHQNVHIYLTKTGIQYLWYKAEPGQMVESKTKGLSTYQMRMELVGAKPEPSIIKEFPAQDFDNYYLPHCPQGITHVKSYHKITYQNVYPYIDFVVYSYDQGLKYDFIIRPGGKVADIKIKYAGSNEIQINPGGSLTVKHALGYLTEDAPFTFQADGKNNREIPSQYVLTDDIITFDVHAYDPDKILIIDPSTVWGTYYGGEASDRFFAVTTDRQGNVYVTGETSSTRGIAFNGFQNTIKANNEAILVKFNADGVRQWATYFGDMGEEYGNALATDANGNVYLAGRTTSVNGMGFNGHQNSYGGGSATGDAFLARFNPEGMRQWVTYYGGGGDETGNGIAVSRENVYLAGTTSSNGNMIASNGHQNVLAGATDAFLVKFTTSGERQWATYYGGSSDEEGSALAIDGNENIYLSGSTSSNDNIALSGHQAIYGGEKDAFLVKFNSAGKRQWSTYYGGNREDQGVAVAVGGANNVYMCGRTGSNTGIAQGGYKNNYTSAGDGFLVKFNTDGVREWGTYYGEAGGEAARSVQADNSGKVYLSGWVSSDDGIAFNGFQNTRPGKTDAFIALFDAKGNRQWASYYGSAEDDYGHGIALGEEGVVYLVGNTYSQTGLVVKNAHQPQNGGASGTRDGFIVKISEDATPPQITALSPVNGAVNVDSASNLILTFNEAIQATGGKIRIYQGDTLLEEIAANNSNLVSFSDKTVTINPAASFASGATVHVLIEKGAFTDKANNPHEGITATTTWRFSIIKAVPVDQTPPVVTLLSPADNTTDAPVNANLIMTFSEPVKKGAGAITIFQNGIARVIDITDQAITVSGTTVAIANSSGFLPGASVYIQMPAGIFVDSVNNAFAGILNETSWNFATATTSDFNAPLATAFTPADETINVGVDENLTITFNKNIRKGAGNIIITQENTSQTLDVASEAVIVNGNTVTINPPDNFPSGASVSVLILPGVFTDLANNPFAGITDASIWNFTVVDYIAPALVSLFPVHKSREVPANINLVLTFNEEIQKGAGQITIIQGTTTQTIDIASNAVIVSGTTAIINPPDDFPFNTTISIQIPAGAFTDLSGNPYAGFTNADTWTLAISDFLDNTPPVALAFSPADNATLVPAVNNLEIIFSENVQKGRGNISINYDVTGITVDVNSKNVMISGTSVRINLDEEFPIGAEVYILIPEGAFTDLSNNPYAGITQATGWNFTVDGANPLHIVEHNFPEVILSSDASVNASIEVDRLPAGTKVELVSKGIAAADWSRTLINATDLRFITALTQQQFDEIGLEYYFDITLASGVKIASDTGYTYIQYTGSGLTIPGLKFGATINAYQMISIPLELQNKQVTAILENNLGDYNIKKWRLFTYENDLLIEYQNGFNSLEPGKGYWLIVKDSSVINTGAGTTLKVHEGNPYIIRLKKGWNQIGNPYNFNVSWNDVRIHNKQPLGLGNLRVFDGGFKDSDILSKFAGAFVFADEDISIQIPVLKNKTANGGRIAAGAEARFDMSSLWEVNFSLQSKEMNYSLGGLGMHAEANHSKDRFDEITLPRFIKYLEINFSHPEYFAPAFTKDIRPVEENQIWDFTVEANITPQTIRLNWQKHISQQVDGSKLFILYDVTHGQAVNLQEQDKYVFHQDSLTAFKLYYGTKEFIDESLQAYQTTLLGNYPNPFRGKTIFEFQLSQASATYLVHFQIFDLQGRLVATLKEGIMEAGLHQLTWEGKDTAGKFVPGGIYMYKLEAISDNKRYVFSRKLIIQ